MNWLDDLIVQASAALTGPEGLPARQYLQQRGVPEALWTRYRLGYTAPALKIHTCSEPFKTWYPTFFFDRLLFPLVNPMGVTVGLQTRCLHEKDYRQFFSEPPEITPYVFGLDGDTLAAIWQTRQVVVVEGAFDLLAIKPYVPNSVSILTAKAPVSVRTFLARYTKRVIALLDQDDAGRRGVDLLCRDARSAGYTVVAPWYPAHDPADLVQTWGDAKLGMVILQAKEHL